jgi:signal transduction histidine kinase
MNARLSQDRLTAHPHRLVIILCCILILVLALRRSYDLAGGFNLGSALLLLGIFTALYASEPLLSKRLRSYPRVYFAAQVIIVLSLGIFREYQDTWSVLFIILGFQVAVRCSRKEATFWFGLFVTSLFITLSAEFGLISGPGRALAYIVIGVLLISYDVQYSRHEDALAESQVLLAELVEANQKLAEYAAQAEELAAMQEHHRMIQELYDSVGQKIFAIQLAAETTRLMLKKDPGRAAGQIDNLQAQTQSALGQMRHLIGQWRPS